jgi:predicted secreted hydrolase
VSAVAGVGRARRTRSRATLGGSRTPRGLTVAAVVFALLAVGCNGAPILANQPLSFPSPQATAEPTSRPADPIPIAFPRDDGPHDRLTEWWYYTGHLKSSSGRRFGFEAVIFRAERSSVPTAWASHLALTDEQGHRFLYAQRSEVGPQADHSPRGDNGDPTGFDLQVGGLSPVLVAAGAAPSAVPWRLSGSNGTDHIDAALTPEEAAAAGAPFALQLDLRDLHGVTRHDGDGFVDFGPAGSSYYYSRMRMEATGSLTLDGQQLDVTGTAWFDHQWGDFVSVGGGWDWFALNLADGTDITLSVVRDAGGKPVLVYGTEADVDGTVRRLLQSDFAIESTGTWTSPHTGRTWPSGWTITMHDLTITLEPTLDDQELDTRATTGVAYWEGSQHVDGRRATTEHGQTAFEYIVGEAYVELTRYSN